jgi:hypothetical protein
MDQTASTHKEFLWYIGKRRKDTNLDCCSHICPGRYNEKTAENRIDSLHNLTDFEHYAVRENAHFTGLDSKRLQKQNY